MTAMNDAAIDDIAALLPPLLQSLEALRFVARHFHPPAFHEVVSAIGRPDDALRAVQSRLSVWPDKLADVRTALEASSDAALAAFDGLRAVAEQGSGDITDVFRALRHLPRGQEALYPLAARLPPVSQFFLTDSQRDDAALQARLERGHGTEGTGVLQSSDTPGERGGYSLYVPEYYAPDRAWPLVMALHGGSGNGRAFLWSWLRDARSLGAIVVAPTATGPTWALMGEDVDSPNLARILAAVRGRWNVDPARLLLTGMSDGGTFAYVSGLDPASPFTHLAPVAAAFHPMLAQAADANRIRNLPISVTHGTLDWMFPVEMAQRARQALAQAGARVTFREIENLSHTYPTEINADLLAWLAVSA